MQNPLERLGEIHDKEDEENKDEQYVTEIPQKILKFRICHLDILVQIILF
jgi:hypothetical protein